MHDLLIVGSNSPYTLLYASKNTKTFLYDIYSFLDSFQYLS